VVGNTHITMLLRQDEGRKGLNTGYTNVRQIATHEAPRIAALLRAFFEGQASMAHPRGKLARRLSIAPLEDVEMLYALTLTDWLQTAYTAAGHSPPEGFS
jgi:hypothetical protein